MSYFGYKFLPRTDESNAHRRALSDRYANIAQTSQLIVHLTLLLCQYASSVLAKELSEKSQPKDNATLLSRTAKNLQLKLGTNVIKGYGTYGQWIFALFWTAWLGFLSTAETAPDYLHVTKRFAMVGASQLPIHYFLAMRHQYLPFQVLLKSSHPMRRSLHKVTGRIIPAFFVTHMVLYSNLFVQFGIFWKTIGLFRIVVALISACIFFTIGMTSTGFFRRRYYSWFYKIHVVGSAAVLPLLYFHTIPIRLYLIESAAVLIMNAALRLYGTWKLQGSSKVPSGEQKVSAN